MPGALLRDISAEKCAMAIFGKIAQKDKESETQNLR